MKHLTFLAATVLAASVAQAAPVQIDFETPTSFESVLEHYNGGTDSAGLAGLALGVQFTADALALQNDALGPYFSNAPSPLGVMAPVGPDATMNFAAGLIGNVNFWYAASQAITQGVQVWSGLGGTGSLLASLNLQANAQDGCNDSAYCNFDWVQADFAGIAYSVTFGNAANVAAFDDIRISAAPEPTGLALVAAALLSLGLARRRG